MSITNLLAMVLDVIGALFLALYALIQGPLGILRGPLALERLYWYMWVLVPQGLVARSMRAAIDWRIGNFDAAIAQLESLVGTNEDYFKAKPTSRSRRRVLEDLYTLLVRTHLHAGHIDDAMLVVIRAKKCLAIDRLGGLAGLDAKTAHLVRAGLAAGRLLDGGGLATMFVKSAQQPPAPGAAPTTPGRSGGVAGASGQQSPTRTSGPKSLKPNPRETLRAGDSSATHRSGATRGDSPSATDSEKTQSAARDVSAGAKVIPLFPVSSDQV